MTLEEQLRAVLGANDELERENERLKAALKPFARHADDFTFGTSADTATEVLVCGTGQTFSGASVGDCRRAAELLAELEGGK